MEDYYDNFYRYLSEAIYEIFMDEFSRSKIIKSNYNYLQNFQIVLEQIPLWNHNTCEKKWEFISKHCGCECLEEYMKIVIITKMKTLLDNCLEDNREADELIQNFRCPSKEEFIRDVISNSARNFYQNPFLFKIGTFEETIENRIRIKNIITENIKFSIQKYLPSRNIMKRCNPENLLKRKKTVVNSIALQCEIETTNSKKTYVEPTSIDETNISNNSNFTNTFQSTTQNSCDLLQGNKEKDYGFETNNFSSITDEQTNSATSQKQIEHINGSTHPPQNNFFPKPFLGEFIPKGNYQNHQDINALNVRVDQNPIKSIDEQKQMYQVSPERKDLNVVDKMAGVAQLVPEKTGIKNSFMHGQNISPRDKNVTTNQSVNGKTQMDSSSYAKEINNIVSQEIENNKIYQNKTNTNYQQLQKLFNETKEKPESNQNQVITVSLPQSVVDKVSHNEEIMKSLKKENPEKQANFKYDTSKYNSFKNYESSFSGSSKTDLGFSSPENSAHSSWSSTNDSDSFSSNPSEKKNKVKSDSKTGHPQRHSHRHRNHSKVQDSRKNLYKRSRNENTSKKKHHKTSIKSSSNGSLVSPDNLRDKQMNKQSPPKKSNGKKKTFSDSSNSTVPKQRHNEKKYRKNKSLSPNQRYHSPKNQIGAKYSITNSDFDTDTDSSNSLFAEKVYHNEKDRREKKTRGKTTASKSPDKISRKNKLSLPSSDRSDETVFSDRTSLYEHKTTEDTTKSENYKNLTTSMSRELHSPKRKRPLFKFS